MIALARLQKHINCMFILGVRCGRRVLSLPQFLFLKFATSKPERSFFFLGLSEPCRSKAPISGTNTVSYCLFMLWGVVDPSWPRAPHFCLVTVSQGHCRIHWWDLPGFWGCFAAPLSESSWSGFEAWPTSDPFFQNMAFASLPQPLWTEQLGPSLCSLPREWMGWSEGWDPSEQCVLAPLSTHTWKRGQRAMTFLGFLSSLGSIC